jgi:GNAT superfamily N-acetyltransferase
MSVVVRPALETDLEVADDLVCRSINDLTVRHGFGPFASPSAPNFQAFSLRYDPEGLWVAEEAERLLGFAFSWVCDDLWFLAQLFVTPDHQGGGIGAELLTRTLAQAEKHRCAHRALITFTFNRVSQALYMRHGLFPTAPVYFFAAETARLRPRPEDHRLRAIPLEQTPGHLHALAKIDGKALGVSRQKHHEYLRADGSSHGFGLFAGSECVGYAYVSKTGHIGPLAVADDADLAGAFEVALGLAIDTGAKQVGAFLPGTARSTVALAIEQRMRITVPMILMANTDIGQWTRYLPRNPGFM